MVLFNLNSLLLIKIIIMINQLIFFKNLKFGDPRELFSFLLGIT